VKVILFGATGMVGQGVLRNAWSIPALNPCSRWDAARPEKTTRNCAN
jgi:hypothetical protein